ncbi:Z-ring positioning protein MinE [Gammaproteobacteria bacterium]
MSLLDYLLGRRKQNTAELAKERLQIILAHERTNRNAPDYLPELQRELLQVVAKYIPIDLNDIQVKLERQGNYEVLELNIPLPEDLHGTTIRAVTPARHLAR